MFGELKGQAESAGMNMSGVYVWGLVRFWLLTSTPETHGTLITLIYAD